MARCLQVVLLVAVAINAQSEEFLRLKKELEERIAALRPEAREVAQRLQAVFEARLPKDEAKARLNAVLESASDAAKSALETLKPDRKIDVELVIPLPEAPVDYGEADRILDRITVPGIDRLASAADRLNLTDKTLTEALRENPNLAAQLGVDRHMLEKIDNLAKERGLSEYTVDNVLHTLRHNLSLIINADERSSLEQYCYAKNITSLEALFESRLRPRVPWPAFRNGTDGVDIFEGKFNHSEFLGHLFNGSDGNFVEKIKQRFGNDTSFLDKLWSNAIGSEKEKLIDSLKTGNFSAISQLFNGTSANGAFATLVAALKTGNLPALATGAGGKNGSAIFDNIKSMLNTSPSESPATSDKLANFGVLTSSFKNFFT